MTKYNKRDFIAFHSFINRLKTSVNNTEKLKNKNMINIYAENSYANW